jgi:hypothetical protein
VEQLEASVSDPADPFAMWRDAAMLNVVRGGSRAEIELFAFGTDSWQVVGLPAESFIASQIAIRAASPCEVLVGAYFACDLWYIPTREAIAVGAYECLGGWNYTTAGTSESITRAAASLMRR